MRNALNGCSRVNSTVNSLTNTFDPTAGRLISRGSFTLVSVGHCPSYLSFDISLLPRISLHSIGSVTTAEGSALVKLGQTLVLCGIKAEITTPAFDQPDQGLVIPNVDLMPICSPSIRPGPPSDEAQVLTARLDELLSQQQQRVLDRTQLCIVPGRWVMALYVHVACLNADGNIWDAVVLATISALCSGKLM